MKGGWGLRVGLGGIGWRGDDAWCVGRLYFCLGKNE